MIHISTTAEDSNYSENTKDVLLTVKHTIKKSDILEMLELYRKMKGDAAYIELIESVGVSGVATKPAYKRPWMCAVQGGNAPSQDHHSISSALEEARRLAVKTGKNVMVLQRHYTVEPICTVNVREP